ncbi:hypothetical protein GMD78_12260 [Ornithinibacillus sp. L9]|uniref:Transglycosylase n=1 Tax=Ornithinibacillus caprae TaxID=2678566 RepID=A0A6N8FMB7_9BACI|nr:hypothetical protein [Ornithinibacillus caprae]MUK89147.1 hypothetical protein [Ornithinibacillus caprae]
MRVTCTNPDCNKVFKMQLKEKNHPRGIKEHYFTCKHCKKRYTSFITDKKVRVLQKEMKRTTDVDRRMAIVKEVEERKKTLMQNFMN